MQLRSSAEEAKENFIIQSFVRNQWTLFTICKVCFQLHFNTLMGWFTPPRSWEAWTQHGIYLTSFSVSSMKFLNVTWKKIGNVEKLLSLRQQITGKIFATIVKSQSMFFYLHPKPCCSKGRFSKLNTPCNFIHASRTTPETLSH